MRHRLLIACLLVVAACGQKPGVHNALSGLSAQGESAGGASDAGSSDALSDSGATDGASLDGGGSTGGTTGSTGGSTGGVSTSGGKTSGTTGTTGGGGGGGTAPIPASGNSTGITATEIRIGIHAPVTGAAPFPAASFDKGKDLYWQWSGAPKIAGRTVKIFFEDDAYNPSIAADKCRKMAEQDKVFMLIGGGGTDQIQACARYANAKNIPYLSAGVTEVGLTTLKTYFAASMSYAQQGPLLWSMIKAKAGEMGGVDKVAMIYTNTPNFQDARDSFVKAMDGDGKKLILERKMSKNPSSSEYQQTATALSTSGATVVFILTAPLHYIQLSGRTGSFRPWWVGVGVSMGINEVLGTGCSTSGNGMTTSRFLSPFPGIDVIDSLDPNYNKAFKEKHGTAGDDLGIALWGLNKTIHQMFSSLGTNLTREAFIAKVSQSKYESGVFPPLSFTPARHFGGSAMHLLKGDCTSKTYKTEKTFASSF